MNKRVRLQRNTTVTLPLKQFPQGNRKKRQGRGGRQRRKVFLFPFIFLVLYSLLPIPHSLSLNKLSVPTGGIFLTVTSDQ
ncbi:hypothetical protein [Scytonema hofmannii]|uniref:hypothetical protein n=1 Tax=Scytonema hofmannii TaxID=34078 RepID=UPI001473606D|nr:hypothetical protein [Scytonema hofmannii]